MEDLIERALTAKIETAAITTVNAAITEAGTQADKIVGTDPLPGSLSGRQNRTPTSRRSVRWRGSWPVSGFSSPRVSIRRQAS